MNLLDGGIALLALGHIGQLGGDAHLGVAAKLDVGAAAGHVGGNGDRARHTGLGNDLGFLLVVAGVEHIVRNALFLQVSGQHFRLLDRGGADQDRLATLLGILDGLDDCGKLFAHRAVYLVVFIEALDWHVGRDFDHVQLVDVHEFFASVAAVPVMPASLS
jgi:hypothetical protein